MSTRCHSLVPRPLPPPPPPPAVVHYRGGGGGEWPGNEAIAVNAQVRIKESLTNVYWYPQLTLTFYNN